MVHVGMHLNGLTETNIVFLLAPQATLPMGLFVVFTMRRTKNARLKILLNAEIRNQQGLVEMPVILLIYWTQSQQRALNNQEALVGQQLLRAALPANHHVKTTLNPQEKSSAVVMVKRQQLFDANETA